MGKAAQQSLLNQNMALFDAMKARGDAFEDRALHPDEQGMIVRKAQYLANAHALDAYRSNDQKTVGYWTNLLTQEALAQTDAQGASHQQAFWSAINTATADPRTEAAVGVAGKMLIADGQIAQDAIAAMKGQVLAGDSPYGPIVSFTANAEQFSNSSLYAYDRDPLAGTIFGAAPGVSDTSLGHVASSNAALSLNLADFRTLTLDRLTAINGSMAADPVGETAIDVMAGGAAYFGRKLVANTIDDIKDYLWRKRATENLELDKPPFPLPQDNVRYSWGGHANAANAEEQLAKAVHSLPDQAVVRWGDKIGTHGSDVISVNVRTGEVTLWDAKYRTAPVKLDGSQTFAQVSRLQNAVDEAVATISSNATLSNGVKQKALRNLQQGIFETRTVGFGNAKNSVLQ